MIYNNQFIGRRNAANILKAFGQNTGNCPSVEYLLQKAEGSRGGKVIGHTKSGKPIYDTFGHEGHKHFTLTEHKEAVSAHAGITSKLIGEKEKDKKKFSKEGEAALKHHGEQVKLHFKASRGE